MKILQKSTLFLSLLLMAGMNTSCIILKAPEKIEASGITSTRDTSLAGFSQLKISSLFQVELVPSGKDSLHLEFDQALEPYLEAEMPGYAPVRAMFKDEGFSLANIPVRGNGIAIEKLPVNLRSVVYVSPSNQYPSGAVMPVGRRYELLQWAEENDSYIFEDDYDSELRYFGKPVPALQGLDANGHVIYLGSFSATLFASIKISYMVLPEELVEIFDRIKDRYSQTCSKAEQICLALYMEEGYYHRHIKKCRRLNAEKLETALAEVKKNGEGLVTAENSRSGLALMLRCRTVFSAEDLCEIANRVGLKMSPVEDLCTEEEQVLNFYYYRVSKPLLQILIKMFVGNVKKFTAQAMKQAETRK